jgi:hypothetical protein
MGQEKQPASRYPYYLWSSYDLFPEAEVRFHPVRKWRFDYAWRNRKIAVEIEGGLFVAGRHGRGAGYRADLEKYNTALLMGWSVYHFLPEQLKNGYAQLFMRKAIEGVL